MALLEIQRLVKDYGSKRAVDRINLTLDHGQIYGLVGPNGAGKTTTIKILVGLMEPTSGEVWFNNQQVTTESLVKAQIGYYPDEPFVFEKLTAREILRLVGRLQDIPIDELDSRIEKYAEMLDLSDQLDQLTETYSRGNRKKIGLITSLLGDHEVVIMDEPTESLDPVAVATFRDIVKELSNRGAGVLISTHNLAFAEGLCTHIGMLNEGRLVFSGTLLEARKHFRLPNSTLENLFMEALKRREA